MENLEPLKRAFVTGQWNRSVNQIYLDLQETEPGWQVSYCLLASNEVFEVRFYGASLLHAKLRREALSSTYQPDEERPLRQYILRYVQEETSTVREVGAPQQIFYKLLQCQALNIVLHRDNWNCHIQETVGVISSGKFQ